MSSSSPRGGAKSRKRKTDEVDSGAKKQSSTQRALLPTHSPQETEFLTGRRLADVASDFLWAGRPDISDTVQNDWRLLLTDTEIQLCIRWIAAEINRRFIGEQIVITGILKGVFMFMADLVKHITIPHTCYFIEATSYSGMQQSDEVQFMSTIVHSKFENRKVILLDELFDNGKTMNSVKMALVKQLSKPAEDIFTCVLFAKDKHAPYPAPNIVGFNEFPDVWLVGYGLDDGGEKRGWPHVFGVPKPPDGSVSLCEADRIFEKTPEGDHVFKRLRARFRAKLSSVAEGF